MSKLTDKSRSVLARVSHNGVTRDDEGKYPTGITHTTINSLNLKGFIELREETWVITATGRTALREHVPLLLHRDSSHGYTDQPAMALIGEPEAIDAATLEQFAKDNRERFDATQGTLEERLAAVRIIAKFSGLDFTLQEAAIEKRIAAMERRARRNMAA